MSLFSCNSLAQEASPPSTALKTTYQRTVLPADTTALWLSPDSLIRDLVIIDCPGGPDSTLEYRPRNRARYRYLSNYDEISVISLHQAQSFNTSMYRYTDEFSMEDARYEVDITVEMLNRAIDYFKSRDKKVIVVGTSYGAFVVQNYLLNEPAKADQYIILSGRLDIDQVMVEETMNGNSGSFLDDGRTYVPDEKPIRIEHKDMDTREDLVCNRLKAAIGHHRYTEQLAQRDLSDVLYFYAVNDQNVGALTKQEIEFLEKRGARVFADDRGHNKTWQRLIDEVEAGKVKL